MVGGDQPDIGGDAVADGKSDEVSRQESVGERAERGTVSDEVAVMRDEFVQRFKRLFRSLFLDKPDCAASAPGQEKDERSLVTILLTGQDDTDGDNDAGCVVKLSHESTDNAASKQQQDQRVLIDLLGKLEVQRV